MKKIIATHSGIPDNPATESTPPRPRKSRAKPPVAARPETAPLPAATGAHPASPAQTHFSTHFSNALVSGGVTPSVGTVLYVHGIGNKPQPSILKCQWDQALFNGPMGDRSRLAYWVDRDRYPVPSTATCASGDLISGDTASAASDMAGGRSAVQSLDQQQLVSTIERLAQTNEQRDHLTAIALRMLDRSGEIQATHEAGVGARVLPLPGFMRRFLTRFVTDLFLKDVSEFLFHDDSRRRMEQTLIERMDAGGGPFVIVAHSLGSALAYDVLRRMPKDKCRVRLFLTFGSPLGMAEVQDIMKGWQPDRPWSVPDCVDQWINVAERTDLVAIDNSLADDFAPNAQGVGIEDYAGEGINRDAPANPHSATGYLASDVVHVAVRQAVGNAFSQLVGQAFVVRDLADNLEDARHGERHATLIQLDSGEGSGERELASLEQTRTSVRQCIEQLVVASGADPGVARLQEMKRFLSADLTRLEIETLRSMSGNSIKIDKVWRNAIKRTLINQSSQTVQARPGNLGYGALGQRICWAVLDTGICGGHPHFRRHGNVVRHWDCTTNGPVAEVPQNGPGSTTFDGNGHGTHVAGILCGEMTLPPEPGKPDETYAGMAPATRLFDFKVLNDSGQGEDAFIIKALDAIAEINERAGMLVVHGLNLSLGGEFDPSVYGCAHTPLCQELRRLWNQGVLVCVAAGNEGYALLQGADRIISSNMDLSIGDPANLDEAIAVGSVHKSQPHMYGVSYFSSRGPTADGRAKPDLVAPGEQIVSAWHSAPDSYQSARDVYIEMSGTSMATPHVSGLLAAFLSVRREFIGYPDRVKQILLDSCTDIGRDPYIQGRGMPNLVQMLIRT